MEAQSGCCTSSTKARLVCVLLCVLLCFLSTACLVAGIVLEPYSLHPSATVISAVQLGSAFLGTMAASVMLCCCHSSVALVLLQIAAVGLISTAIGLAFVCELELVCATGVDEIGVGIGFGFCGAKNDLCARVRDE
mgnify:CR=1 FL=1